MTLDEEGGMLRRYLEIQRSRFPDRLTFGIDIAPAVRRAGVCSPIPETCSAFMHQPVCGCDGQIYANSCFAAQTGVSVANAGDTCRLKAVSAGDILWAPASFKCPVCAPGAHTGFFYSVLRIAFAARWGVWRGGGEVRSSTGKEVTLRAA